MALKNIDKTKLSLKVAFSVIVFATILLLGLIYFTGKYVREIGIEQKDFSRYITLIEAKKINPWDFGNGSKVELTEDTHHMGQMSGIKITGGGLGLGGRGFVNFILIGNSKIVSSDIKDEVPEKLVLDSISKDKYYSTVLEGSFLVQKVKFSDGRIFVAYKKIPYSLSNYWKDVFGFLFITILFTVLVYFIGNKFVDKVFVPVEENLKDMKDFVHNAGHELKTPISVIDSNIQLMLDIKDYDEEMLLEQKKEILKLNSLIDSLLGLSDFDFYEKSSDINLKESIEEVLNDFKNKIKNKNINLKLNIKDDVFVNANKEYFYIFISNIIGNAIKYNKDGGNLEIYYKSGKLNIKDSGVGIKYEDLDKIFDRFFKSDQSRNTEGFGIGLSLVKKVSDLYEWEIKVESKEGEGTKFIIKF